jgi:predicted AlkP superfamily phosphohydrolase/phosphomutase
MTYPPKPVNGFTISSFTTPEGVEDWIYPPALANEFTEAGIPYPMQKLHDLVRMKNLRGHGNTIKEYVDKWEAFTQEQTDAICYLFRQRRYDFFMVVFSSTDHINHHTPDLNHIRRIYEQVDEAIGRILSVVDDDTIVLVVSDHGSAPLKRYIVLNRFLADLDLIAFKPEIASRHIKRIVARYAWSKRQQITSLWLRTPAILRRLLSWPLLQLDNRLRFDYENIDWQHTRAYALSGIGSLFINLKGREPEGIVKPGVEYEQLCEKIISELLSLRDENGQPLIKEAHRAKTIFHGPHMAHAPDIVFSRYSETDRAVMGFATDPIVRSTLRSDGTAAEYGYHTSKGILIARGSGLKVGAQVEGADIHDIAPTVLHLLGQAVPMDMDGHVLQDLFTESQAVTMIEREKAVTESRHGLSGEAKADIEERLRLLGYLE